MLLKSSLESKGQDAAFDASKQTCAKRRQHKDSKTNTEYKNNTSIRLTSSTLDTFELNIELSAPSLKFQEDQIALHTFDRYGIYANKTPRIRAGVSCAYAVECVHVVASISLRVAANT